MASSIVLGVGGFGTRAASAFFDEVRSQHAPAAAEGVRAAPVGNFSTHFSLSSSNQLVPRGVLVDMDSWQGSELFDPRHVHCSPPPAGGAGSSFARSHLSQGLPYSSAVLESVRRLAEAADARVGAVELFHSASGGASSGLTAAILDALADDFPCAERICHTLVPPLSSPSSASSSPLESWNFLLATEHLVENAGQVLLYDNAALQTAARRRLPSPNQGSLTEVVAAAAAHYSVAQRFGGGPGPQDFVEALAPFSVAHFLVPTLAPLLPDSLLRFQKGTAAELFESAFGGSGAAYLGKRSSLITSLAERSSSLDDVESGSGGLALCSADPTAPGRVYLAAGGVLRGSEAFCSEAEGAATGVLVKYGNSFAPFARSSFPLATAGPQAPAPRPLPEGQPSALFLANSTAVALPFLANGMKVHAMYKARVHLHTLEAQGLEKAEIKAAYQTTSSLIEFYESAESY